MERIEAAFWGYERGCGSSYRLGQVAYVQHDGRGSFEQAPKAESGQGDVEEWQRGFRDLVRQRAKPLASSGRKQDRRNRQRTYPSEGSTAQWK